MESAYKFQHAWLGQDELESDVTVRLSGDRIADVSVGSDEPATPIPGVAMPGMVSTHSHLFHRGLRGRTHSQGGDFWAWRKPMYELADSLDPDSYYAMACDVFGEMLRSGYTTVGEFHYLHHQADGDPYADANAMGIALLSAAETVGIRCTLLDTLYLYSDVSGAPPLPRQRRFSDGTADAWADRVTRLGSTALTKVGVAAHSVRAVQPEDLQVVSNTGMSIQSPIHIHVSEQPAENAACEAHFGVSPVELLEGNGMLTDRTTLVHATHVAAVDRERISHAGASVCFCPTTEADLGDGIGPAVEYAEAGIDLSIGSDSNAVIDPLLELRHLEYHDRLRKRRRGIHSPTQLLRYATVNGAKALGWDSGELAPGKLADIVILDVEPGDLAAGTGMLALGTTAANVSNVMVGGKMVLT